MLIRGFALGCGRDDNLVAPRDILVSFLGIIAHYHPHIRCISIARPIIIDAMEHIIDYRLFEDDIPTIKIINKFEPIKRTCRHVSIHEWELVLMYFKEHRIEYFVRDWTIYGHQLTRCDISDILVILKNGDEVIFDLLTTNNKLEQDFIKNCTLCPSCKRFYQRYNDCTPLMKNEIML